jgi:phage terminase large subunit-like protein
VFEISAVLLSNSKLLGAPGASVITLSIKLWAAAVPHGGNPVTRWMAANVAVAQDPAGNLKPAKDKSTERIDGIVATIMAIGRAIVAQEEPQPQYSVFCM